MKFGRAVPVDHGLIYSQVPAGEQVGRSLLIFQERKVRTLQGSEPANGGAFDDLRLRSRTTKVQQKVNQPSEISNFRSQVSDLRSQRVMGEMVRPARA